MQDAKCQDEQATCNASIIRDASLANDNSKYIQIEHHINIKIVEDEIEKPHNIEFTKIKKERKLKLYFYKISQARWAMGARKKISSCKAFVRTGRELIIGIYVRSCM